MISSISAGWPKMCTGRMALVFEVIFLRMLAGSRQKLSGRMSANTGVAPTISMVSAEAKNVNGVVMTSSPGPMPSARSDKYNESVPLATPMACFTPTYPANSFSNACMCGPSTKLPRLPVSRIAASHSASNCLYCAVRSRNGTGMGLVTACIGKSSPSPAKRRAAPPARRGH